MTDLRLFLCGDVMLGRGIDQILRHPSEPRLYEPQADSALTYVLLAEVGGNRRIPRLVAPTYVWGDSLAVLRDEKPAARIINLETAITTSDDYAMKGINYRMHPGNIDCLTAARIDGCVLANNHVLDWGRGGLLETLATLRRAGIRYAGAGHDAAEAAAPAILPVAGGGRLLIFGFAAITSGVPREWAAEAARPGVNLLPDLSAETAARLAETARTQRRPGDLLIASVHWGGNWGYDIPDTQRAFAHALVDGGFDIVHGHSSHHAKGIEVYREKLILYGCGDFINDYEGISGYEEFRGDLAVMYLPRLDGADGRLLSLDMVPMRMRQFRLRRPSGEDATWLYETLARESAQLGARLHPGADGRFSIGGL
jgi:poly-gamma-glutamate synthesis protein (capsule biosynthesis protein)